MKTGVVRTILAVALLSLFASPVSAADEVDASTCGQNTDCSSCVGMAGCGWCEYTSTCSSGSSSGPTSGSCGEGWAYYSSDCNCFNHYSCSTCTEYSGCAWCSTFSTSCVPGTSSGPQGTATCDNDDWNTEYYQCDISCSYYYGCASCTAQLGCGWCSEFDDDDGSDGSCMKGSSMPTGSDASCSTDWKQYITSCPNDIIGMSIVVFVFVVIILPVFILIVIASSVSVAVRRARVRRMSYGVIGGNTYATTTTTFASQPQATYGSAQPQYYAPPAAQPANGNPYQAKY